MIYDAYRLPKHIKITLLIICIIGMVWIFGQFMKMMRPPEPADIPPENAVQCDAVITEVVHNTTRSGRSTGTVLHIRYKFEGTEYNEKIYAGYTMTQFKEGQVLHLTVDKTDPHYAIVNSDTENVDFLSVMTVFVMVSFALVAVLILSRKSNESE
ncbi:MAG: DUF3592 domain-containing protein [Oscillospiraceae bacterium]|nr:DUF3592 domain-containing protein [Oscillospiraceae bacterium]